MGKPGKKKFTKAEVQTLLELAKKDPVLSKEIVRKRRHSIAHALSGDNPGFIAEAKKKGITIS
jgi:hypothetical protein